MQMLDLSNTYYICTKTKFIFFGNFIIHTYVGYESSKINEFFAHHDFTRFLIKAVVDFYFRFLTQKCLSFAFVS